MTFRAWMAQVDAAVSRVAGLSVYDLADYPFRDAFEDEVDPEDVAREILEDEGFPFADPIEDQYLDASYEDALEIGL